MDDVALVGASSLWRKSISVCGQGSKKFSSLPHNQVVGCLCYYQSGLVVVRLPVPALPRGRSARSCSGVRVVCLPGPVFLPVLPARPRAFLRLSFSLCVCVSLSSSVSSLVAGPWSSSSIAARLFGVPVAVVAAAVASLIANCSTTCCCPSSHPQVLNAFCVFFPPPSLSLSSHPRCGGSRSRAASTCRVERERKREVGLLFLLAGLLPGGYNWQKPTLWLGAPPLFVGFPARILWVWWKRQEGAAAASLARSSESLDVKVMAELGRRYGTQRKGGRRMGCVCLSVCLCVCLWG